MMKKAIIIPVIALFSVILTSCPDPNVENSSKKSTFWAMDMTDKSFYQVKAEKLYESDKNKCEIWAETGSGVTKAMAEDIAREYDLKIRPCVVDTFSEKNFTIKNEGVNYFFNDILDCANWLTGRNNKKLTILLLDIKDGFRDSEQPAYVAGYFYALDLFKKGPHPNDGNTYYSNGRDMIYVDTYPGLKTQREQAYSTFAHELQHLVNFVTTVLINRVNAQKELILTDTWVNEGLSAYAEYLYLGGHPQDKRAWLSDSRNTIKTGNNFFVWGNHDDEESAILDDYATVYLFFQWLYLQANTELKSHIFYDIITSEYPDYRAITSVMGSDWQTLLRKWLAANYYPGNSYGYIGDTKLQEMIKIDPIPGNTVSLYPGEGVYSIMSGSPPSPPPAAGGPNIRYAGLASSGAINTSSPYSGDVLLTFNANTTNSSKTAAETGSLTGVSPSVTTSSRMAADNARQAGKWNGPYVIDAQDLLGRDREKFNFRVPR